MSAEMYAAALEEAEPASARALLESSAADGHADSLLRLAQLADGLSFEGLARGSPKLARAAAMGHADALYLEAVWPEVARIARSSIIGGGGGKLPSSSPSAETPTFRSRLERAALFGSMEAKLALAHELRRAGKCRASLFYFAQAAEAAGEEHSARGKEPLVELQTLSDFVEERGERGEDDENIQYQLMLADQGDAGAQFAVGGLYYWGSRGLARDQARALRYFERAAASGHAGAQTACGNMLLKGEGVAAKNTSGAKAYYEKAADQDSLEALNGLGYLYFFGDESAGVTKNISKALEYFERNLRDGDSLANAAHVYLHEDAFRDVARARRYLERAATEFGSFSAAKQLGLLLASTDASTASCWRAQRLLRLAALKASWGHKLREGFDAFLEGELEASAVHYLHAGLLGYSRGAENAAWLLKSRLGARHLDDRLFAQIDAPVPPLQRLAQGDLLMQAGDPDAAVQAWVAASVDGDWALQRVYRAQACYNLGARAMALGDLARAGRYFDRATAFLEEDDSEEADAARLALTLVAWRLKIIETAPAFIAPLFL